MKRSVTNRAAILCCALAFFGQPAPAASAECEVSAYDAYLLARQQAFPREGREVQFLCRWGADIHFRADPDRGLVCSGTAPEQTGELPTYSGRFFTTPGSSIGLANGWKVSGFEVTGGAYGKRSRRDVLVLFDFWVPGGASDFEREVRSIILKKRDGDCSRALEEAFGWSG